MNPFDYVNAINTTKKNLMVGTENDRLAEKGYDPFLTNRSLSYHNDTIGLANEMNTRHYLDKKPQFEFFINTVRPKKRFAKWVKKQKDSDVAVVKEYYGYNDVKARQALTILSDEQITEIRTRIDKGGRDAKQHDRGTSKR
jgi:hypothetical protein